MKSRKPRFSFKDVFLFMSSSASILGCFYVLLTDEVYLIIALVALSVALIIVVCVMFNFFTTWVEPQSGGREIEKRTTFIKYETTKDAKRIVYEVYRLIQVKCYTLSEYVYDFQWSGTKPPVFSCGGCRIYMKFFVPLYPQKTVKNTGK